ncbi:RhtX rhizobactin transporter [Mesorhizobium sp. Root554]|uniref:RhtX/FptX family siderophore transporter n=1 Tax=unclassified Mesorhizobium TaxID=325217 RepID=UPI0006FF10DB|nr:MULTISPECIES: RhtX/FptX family siderophore transporter [unclassified Mesorhizobium]KQZ15015.1 RhtX rhizobactin transporter [Mesorhizobium sp. Root1471]KQZ37524.1 RhtX rhizobactin transporter [Mesorhizobium sp. Root554]
MSPSAERRAPGASRIRLFVVLACLYLAQAIPSYLFAAAIPPILREQGVSRTAIGMMALLMLPLILKFLWAPLVDRFRPVARAHRAGWVIITQIGVIAGIAAMMWVEPTDVTGIFAIGFVVSVLMSTQDIATDGYAAKYLDPKDRPIGNAIQGGSVALGVVLGGTLGLLTYHHFGWTSMLAMVASVSVIPLFAALAMRETDPVSNGQAAITRPSITRFLRRPEARQILWIALIYRASEGLVKSMEGSYLVDAGVPLDIIGYLSGGAAFTVGLGGSALAAWLLHKRGAASVLGLLGTLRTVCFLMFALHAFGALTGFWPIFGASFLQTLVRYMEIVALYSLFMAVTSSDQPGTDFTILSCTQLIVYLVGSMLAGRLADMLGYSALFTLAAALSAIAVIATYRMLNAYAADAGKIRANARPLPEVAE